MSKFLVKKTQELKGSVEIDGAKNAALPILAATVLADEPCKIRDVPNLSDVKEMCKLLEHLGAENLRRGKSISIDCTNVNNFVAPYELVGKFRGSFLVAGPLLAKYHRAKISLPGGCPIGSRPIDLHLKGFAAMGAEINYENGYVELRAKRLKGTKLYLDFPSVGATENIMMAACLADGQTIIENAATEPEITDLATFLMCMGADIKGAGTDTIRINGMRELRGAAHTVIPDRIEAGTFMAMTALIGGSVAIKNVVCEHVKPITAKLKEIGAQVQEMEDEIWVTRKGELQPTDIKTLPFPGFPTDMQSQFTTLMSLVHGTSMIVETVFENRFMHVGELRRMGANIKVEGCTAVIEGVDSLSAATVKAPDLRAGAALVMAGMCADGDTIIEDIRHIDRGYYQMEKKVTALGGRMERI